MTLTAAQSDELKHLAADAMRAHNLAPPILLYGESYWREIVNFEALVRHEVISQQDLELFTFVDEPAAALAHLQELLTICAGHETPAFAHSRHVESR